MLAAVDLSFDFPGVRALDGVSFVLPPRSITALIGPNGAGKTSLLRCLAALVTPHSGRVLLGGSDIHEHPRRSHRLIGYLPDDFGVYRGLTARQCLEYRAAAQRVPEAEIPARVSRAAELLALTSILDRRAGTLSRGQRQRLAIAESTLHQPSILLLDEPASGLDPEARIELSATLRQLAESGMTILVSSHILAELEDYCTHVLVLRNGRVLEHRSLSASSSDGSIEVYVEFASAQQHLSEFLAGLSHAELLSAARNSARLRIHGGPVQVAAVLRALIDGGLDIVEWRLERDRLHEIYFGRRTVS